MIPRDEIVRVSMARPWEADAVEEAREKVRQRKGDMQAVMRWLASCLLYAGWKHDKSRLNRIQDYFAALQEANAKHQDIRSTEWFAEYAVRERCCLDRRVPEDVDLFDIFEFLVSSLLDGASECPTLSQETLATAFANTFDFIHSHLQKPQGGNQ